MNVIISTRYNYLMVNIVHKLSILDELIYTIDCLIILLFLAIYYKVTQKYSWYIINGEYWIDEDELIFNIKNKLIKIKFCHIDEIFMAKNNLIGSYHTILLIKWNKKKIKLISKPMYKCNEIYDEQFVEIFKLIKNHSKKLSTVKDLQGNDIDYWLSKY